MLQTKLRCKNSFGLSEAYQIGLYHSGKKGSCTYTASLLATMNASEMEQGLYESMEKSTSTTARLF